MQFDIVMPTALFIIITAIIFLYSKYERKFKALVEEKELRIRDIALLVIAMGVMVTAIIFIPGQALQIVFMASYSLILFTFAYTTMPKWYVAVVPPAIFILIRILFWNNITLNIFGAVFVMLITVYLGTLFTWKTTVIFAGLLTVMDIVQVLLTGFMGASAEKLLSLELPVVIRLATFPSVGETGLGLGDFFLAGLLCIHTSKKYGRRMGILAAFVLSMVFLIGEALLIAYRPGQYFPATVLVLAGWLTAFPITYFYAKKTSTTT